MFDRGNCNCYLLSYRNRREKEDRIGESQPFRERTLSLQDSDLECALGTLKMYCAQDTIPWEALTYTFGEVNYGGRVTDYWDQRTLKTILLTYFGFHTLAPDYVYSASGTYYCPETEECNTLEMYREFVEELPIIEEPEIFGMHDNANIAFQMKETKNVIQTIMEVQPREGGSSEGKSPDELVLEQCDSVIERIKTKIDKDNAHPSLLEKGSKTLVCQMLPFAEIIRFLDQGSGATY